MKDSNKVTEQIIHNSGISRCCPPIILLTKSQINHDDFRNAFDPMDKGSPRELLYGRGIPSVNSLLISTLYTEKSIKSGKVYLTFPQLSLGWGRDIFLSLLSSTLKGKTVKKIDCRILLGKLTFCNWVWQEECKHGASGWRQPWHPRSILLV